MIHATFLLLWMQRKKCKIYPKIYWSLKPKNSDNTNSFKYEHLENEGRITPESLLLEKSTETKSGIQVQISAGISVEKELQERFNLWSWLKDSNDFEDCKLCSVTVKLYNSFYDF